MPVSRALAPLPPPDVETAWERQPTEPGPAYHAFTHYRDAPIENRSIDKAWRTHQDKCLGRQTAGSKRAERAWWTWSTKFGWLDRTDLFDAHADRQARHALAKDRIEAAKRHARQAAGAANVLMAPVRVLMEAMQDPAVLQRAMADARASPKEFWKLVNMVSWAARSLPGLWEIERLSLGMTTEEIGIQETPQDDVAARFGHAITGDPVVTDLALDLLDQLTRRAGASVTDGPGRPGRALADGRTVADGPPSPAPDEDPA